MKKIFAIIAISLAILLIFGWSYQTRQSQADFLAYPAPGKLYDVDGIKLHLDCRGTGSPTLIMEAGLTSGSNSWLKIRDGLSQHTRFCAYDRPGMDWSEAITHPADSKEVAGRLHKLLATANIEGDKILVGMSAGGIYVREYYQHYPQDIVGMVFIDSSHEQQADRLPKIEAEDTLNNTLSACKIAQPVGLVRLFGLLDPFINNLDIDDSEKPQWLALLNRTHACASLLLETESFAQEVLDEDKPKSLGDLPLLVLSQGEEPKANIKYGISKEAATAMRNIWNILQQELAALSTNSERFIAYNSGHVIQINQPELVINKINDLVTRIRQADTSIP